MNDSLSPPAALPAATDLESNPTSRPAASPPDAANPPRPRVAEGLTESLIESALEAGHECRANGWTRDRIRAFLNALAECGVVDDAARAAGMTRQSAYAFRNRDGGDAFQLAWRAAQAVARGRLADEVMSRALNGCVELIYRDGELWEERHRYDNRLSMAVLKRLDDLAQDGKRENRFVNHASLEFAEFVDIVCEGGADAAEFLESCDEGHHTGPLVFAVLNRLFGRNTGAGESDEDDGEDARKGPGEDDGEE
ncbi:MAG TPA: hypothetical protein VIT38_14095 [Allosphingosinicella sp.]